MIERPEVVTTKHQLTAIIHLTIPKAAIQKEMGPAIQELYSVLREQGISPEGPWYSHHLAMSPDTWDFEVGVPTKTPVTPQGRVKPGDLRAATVARAVYHGGYDGLGAGWGELMSWISENKHTACGDLWEVYMKGPESTDDPAQYRTELNRPLVS
ncbi:MAG: GyrI-like domain-containing protein [Polyangiaceae bacterium]